jgi:ATP-dependent Clp protease ATP-binding subunit ClpX
LKAISRVIKSRLNTRPIGFADQEEQDLYTTNFIQYVTSQDLKNFGLIPELIGRLPVITHLNPLDESALRKILIEPKNAVIKQYNKLFKMEGIALHFEPEAIDFIVEKALQLNLGARGLRSICEAIMTDLMFELPSLKEMNEYTITKTYTEEKFSKSKYSKLKVA